MIAKFYHVVKNLIKFRSIILGNVVLGSNVFIRYSFIKGNVKIMAGSTVFRANLIGDITIEANTSITGPYTYLHSIDEKIVVGKRCAIAPQTSMITSGHNRFVKPKSFSSGGEKTEGSISIGNDVWLGAGSIVVGNCQILDNVSVGAGSVLLAKTYGPDSFYAGVPAVEKSSR